MNTVVYEDVVRIYLHSNFPLSRKTHTRTCMRSPVREIGGGGWLVDGLF